jgi:hypothetical protein
MAVRVAPLAADVTTENQVLLRRNTIQSSRHPPTARQPADPLKHAGLGLLQVQPCAIRAAAGTAVQVRGARRRPVMLSCLQYHGLFAVLMGRTDRGKAVPSYRLRPSVAGKQTPRREAGVIVALSCACPVLARRYSSKPFGIMSLFLFAILAAIRDPQEAMCDVICVDVVSRDRSLCVDT